MDDAPTTADRLEIPRLHSHRARWVAFIVPILLVVGGLTVYLLLRRPQENPYRMTPIQRANIIKEIRVTGHLELVDEMEVPAPVEGQLVGVLVKEGDEVEQGQLLAQLDHGSASLSLDVAQAELRVAEARASEAEATAKQAQQSLERTQRLAEKGLASDRALQTARSDAAKAAASFRAARAERAASQKRLAIRSLERKQTDIVSPRDGLVLEVPARTGVVVGPQTKLFRIGAPLDQMNIKAPIGEADIGEIAIGQGAKFEVPAYPGRLFDATVAHISPDPHSEYEAIFYDVTLATSNPDHVLLPGMTTQVRIKVAEVDDVLAVREAALRFTPEGATAAPARTRIWLVKGTQLEEVAVEPGLSDGAMTEVRPAKADSLQVGNKIAIGLTLGGDDSAAGPSLTLRGKR